MLSGEKAKKKAFVDNELSKVIKAATNGAVKELLYLTPDDYEEIVEIAYENGYVKQARVSGDSLWGILVDVVKVVNY